MRTILITGVTSGFGALTLSHLLQEGYSVAAWVRGGDARLRQLRPEFAQVPADRLRVFNCELMDPTQCERATLETLAWIEGHGAKLHAVIHNAGYGLFGNIEDQTQEQFRQQLEVCFFAPVFITRGLLPRLRQDQGRVIFVTSVMGLYSLPLYGPYTAAKHALDAWAESLHCEMAPFGVSVSLVQPGAFRTDFTGRSKAMAATARSPHAGALEAFRRIQEKTESRLANPARVARLMVRLCRLPRPKLRYLIGADAWSMHLISRVIPDSWRVAVLRLVYRLLLRSGRSVSETASGRV